MFFTKENPQEPLLEELSKLDALLDPFPWTKDHWLAMAKGHDEALFLLKDNEKIIGWAVFKLIGPDSLAHLLKVLILPEFRRKGYGELLLKNSLRELEKSNYLKFYLEVEKGNPAIFVYKKLGLKEIHTIPNFYGAGRDAIVMTR